jgi:hypothetical protein
MEAPPKSNGERDILGCGLTYPSEGNGSHSSYGLVSRLAMIARGRGS